MSSLHLKLYLLDLACQTASKSLAAVLVPSSNSRMLWTFGHLGFRRKRIAEPVNVLSLFDVCRSKKQCHKRKAISEKAVEIETTFWSRRCFPYADCEM